MALMKYTVGEYKNSFRPRALEYVVGQQSTKKFLINSLKDGTLPQTLLFYGASGVGKTTVARIIAAGLNCEEGVSLSPCGVCDNCRSIFSSGNPDYKEINVADKSGIDNIRNLIETFKFSPMYLKDKIYILDEVHMLSKAGQNALLKALEDTPPNVYIIFCTTDKSSLIPTLLNRCYDFHFRPLTEKQLLKIINSILEIEGHTLSDEIINSLVELSKGSARYLVVNLQKLVLAEVKTIEEAGEVLGTELIQQQDVKHLSKAVLAGDAKTALKIISKYSYEDCDMARNALINYLGAVLVNSTAKIGWAKKLSYTIDILAANINKPSKGLFVNDIFKITLRK